MTIKKAVLWIGVLLLLGGCTATAIQETDLEQEESADSAENYWWRIKFRLVWPDNGDPDFSLHPLIADQILRPAIDQYGEQFELWRFHRRAAQDKAGHQFTFIYFTDEITSQRVNQSVKEHPLTVALLDAGVLTKVIYTNGRKSKKGDVAATSDPVWTEEIQKSWPWYILGVSETWLDLIKQFTAQTPPPENTDIQALRFYYTQLNNNITAQWGRYGRHAYLHHLNALFGYVPVYIERSGTWEYF